MRRNLFYVLLIVFCSDRASAISLSDTKSLLGKKSYSVELNGDKSLRELLENEIDYQRESNPQLQQLIKSNKFSSYERGLLLARLKAEGYYSSSVRVSFNGDQVTYLTIPGSIYRITDIDVDFPNDPLLDSQFLNIQTGASLRATTILTARKALADYVAENYCLLSVVTDYKVVIDKSTATAHVTFSVAPSPKVTFGNIQFYGITTISEDYLRDRLSFKSGECFKRKKIDSARMALLQTDLVANADIKTFDLEGDTVPIVITIVERNHKTISAGLGYDTDEGFGASIGWEHRNLLGRGQKFSINTHVAERTQTVSIIQTIPHFRRSSQAISFYSDLERKNTDAYISETGSFGTLFTRSLKKKLSGTVGAELSYSTVEEDKINDTYALFSVPLTLEYDKRDAPLNPEKGWVLSGLIRPYWDGLNQHENFTKTSIAASIYLPLRRTAHPPILALRAAFGVLNGENHDRIPATVRFYAGGGGSVRGYAFQSAGHLTDKDPDGGLSFTELSMETRFRWGQNWGAALFLDGGYAYESATPNWGQDLLWGAGLGLRYFTSFAPIRVDISFPQNKREGIDDNFQLYISIGQAF